MKLKTLSYSDELLRSAFASKLAYSRGNINHKSMKNVNTQLHGINNSLKPVWRIPKSIGVHVYAYQSGDRSYVIAFKGSSSISDFQAFFDDNLVPFNFREKSVKIHKGVLSLFENVETSLTNFIFPMIKLNDPLFITFCGHSLGGSIAMLASVYYSSLSNGNIQTTCHTFGSPKMGDISFNKWILEDTNSIINIQNRGDIIPMLPYNSKYTLPSHYLIGNHNIDIFKQHDLDTYIENLINVFQIQRLI